MQTVSTGKVYTYKVPQLKSSTIDAPAVRVLIWVYFLLLMVEGMLRKWLLPQLSDPLLLIREPFLVLIYICAIARRAFVLNLYTLSLGALGAISFLTGMMVGSHNLMVTSYGFDSMFFHLPLIFVIGNVMTHSDVIKIGRILLLLTVPMAILMVLQFRAPPTAWINCGAGGGIGAQIGGALGKIRPPGFFTFVTGAAQFLALATAFIIFGFWKEGAKNRLLLLVAGLSVAVAASVSTSRLAIGAIGTVFVMVGVVIAFDTSGFGKFVKALVPLGVIMVIATNMDIFKEGKHVFEVRLEEAGDLRAGVLGTASNWSGRIFGDFYGGYLAVQAAPILGAGLGVGTNVGARVLSGNFGFLLAEGEWARVVLELGPILAFPYLLLRLLLCLELFSSAAASAKRGNALPMLLFGSCALLITSGQFSQTSTLGFAALGAGLCLAAGNSGAGEDFGNLRPIESGERKVYGIQKRIGCSTYALALRESRATDEIGQGSRADSDEST